MSRNRLSAKKAGTAWETAIVRTLIERGWPHAERRRLSGIDDRGDIAGVVGVCIEAKNTARIEVSTFLDEAQREGANANAAVSVAWIKRRGKPNPGDGYVLMDGETFMALLENAGY